MSSAAPGTRVAFAGLGAMGWPMAARLVGEFGLPAAAAREYAEILRPREPSAGAGVARWVNSVRAASNSLPAGGTDQ